jgi:hypothetical protein
MMKRITALTLWGLLLAAPGFAAEFDADDSDDEPKQAKEEEGDKKGAKKSAEDKEQKDYEEYGPWQVKVPREFRGFKLRIGDEVVDLRSEEITLKGSDYRERIELIDDGGRIMSSDTLYVDPYVFDYVDERNWRVSLYFGGASVNGSKFRSILQDNWLRENSLDLEYQPGPIGAMLTLANLYSSQGHGEDVTSLFESVQVRLGATYEWVPLRRGNVFWRKLHMLTYAGILSAFDEITISDDEVELKDESSSNGFYAGNDVMFPFWKFWVSVRLYVSYHKIEFEKFDFEQQSVQRGALIGGSYAF